MLQYLSTRIPTAHAVELLALEAMVGAKTEVISDAANAAPNVGWMARPPAVNVRAGES